jgi:hypothetical protein
MALEKTEWHQPIRIFWSTQNNAGDFLGLMKYRVLITKRVYPMHKCIPLMPHLQVRMYCLIVKYDINPASTPASTFAKGQPKLYVSYPSDCMWGGKLNKSSCN